MVFPGWLIGGVSAALVFSGVATGAGPGLVTTTVSAGSAAVAAQPDPIQIENALPGNSDGVIPGSNAGRVIEGYGSEVSALPGDTLHFHVSTSPAASYRVEVYRLGWYGGAGARLIGCAPSCAAFRPGQPQPIPAPDSVGFVQAGWPLTDSFTLAADATSGYYRVRFLLADGRSATTYVIVRAPAGYQASILVQVPVNTWQAYNSWGGSSLYTASPHADRVSFNRPYDWNTPSRFTPGRGEYPYGWEYPFVLYLEQAGYDVSYQTDLDSDNEPTSLLGHRLVIALGHDEYWTAAMRQAFETARDSGVNLAFMGSNDVYWRGRYEDGGRTFVVYKLPSAPDPIGDPTQKTGLFRVVDRYDCQLIGIQHQGGELNWQPGDYTVVASSLNSPWFAGTGFAPGSVVRGVVGIETDTIPSWDNGASCGHTLTVFFHHEAGGDQLGNANATAYTAPSGATVFAAGSKRFVWGLADPPPITGRDHGLVDPRLQRFVHNMLDDLSLRRVADLRLSLSTQTKTTKVGKTIKVAVAITNAGPNTATAARLDVTLPPGLRFIRVASKSIRCTLRPLACSFTDIPVGSNINAVFTLKAVASGRYTLAARLFTLIATDPNPGTAQAHLAITCQPKPDSTTTPTATP